MFQAAHRPSSGAQKLQLQPLVLPTFLFAGCCVGSAIAAAGKQKVDKTRGRSYTF
jgi:hypothetical protein